MAPKDTLRKLLPAIAQSGEIGAAIKQLSVSVMLTKEDCHELVRAIFKAVSASQFEAFFF
jgi:hypothetical protein